MNDLRMCYPDGRKKALTLSYDDGVEQDIRLLELMTSHGVKGTFNISSALFAPEGTVYPAGQIHRRMPLSKCLELYNSPMAEVAIHGLYHPFLEQIPSSAAMLQVIEDRKNLELLFGKLVRGMAYPYGTYSDDVVDILRLAGVAYSRTTYSHMSFALPEDWLRLGATCHHNCPELMSLAKRFLADAPTRDPYLFYLWGHSYEFEANDNWNVIEEFLDCVSNHDDVWYATNLEIYDYVAAFKSLLYSADGNLAFNPSVTDVWVGADGKNVRIPSGETVALR